MTPGRRRRPLVLGATLLVAACAGSGNSTVAGRLPDIDLPPLAAGAPLELAELTGPAVVNLWATWCAPCRRELPAFQQASGRWTEVSFIGVDIAEDPVAAQAFLDRLGVTFPQHADRDGALTEALGIASLPVTLLVDARGDVRTHLGPMSSDELEEALADLT